VRIVKWLGRMIGRVVFFAVVLVLATVSTVSMLAFALVPNGDWRPAEIARYTRDIREGARRVSESAARQRRDVSRMRSQARQILLEKRQELLRFRVEMKAALRELKESVKPRRHRNRDAVGVQPIGLQNF
jgi:hypothetical protein